MNQYINQFNILGKTDGINCEYLSQLMYTCLLNKFNIKMSEDEFKIYKEYQNRVFDLIEDLRTKDAKFMSNIFDYLSNKNIYISDIIIMCWCLPRPGTFVSNVIYDNYYRDNIKEFSPIMVKNITHNVMKNFCTETLSKTNNVPIHCIDYIWYYMSNISIDLNFIKYDRFLSIEYLNNPIENQSEFVYLNVCLQYLLDLGLGCVVYEQDPLNKGSMRNFLANFMFDINFIETMIRSDKKANFRKQLSKIYTNPTKYFSFVPENLPLDAIKRFIG